MPTIAILGDVHGEHTRLAATLGLLAGARVDVVLLVGDVGLDPPWSSPARVKERDAHDASVRRVLEQVREAFPCPALFVPGNHDLPDPADDVGGLNADGRIVEAAGLSVAGFGGAGPARFGFPYEWSDSEAEASLSGLLSVRRERLDVLLCHAPPLDTGLDRIHDGRHVGSAAIRAWIPRARPRMFVCGHIHEAWGVEMLDGVPCVNAGALGAPYEQEIIWLVDWDAGPARIESTRRRDDGTVERKLWPI